MAVFETWMKSDLKKPLKVKPLTGNLFSADNQGNLIGVEVMDGGNPAELSGNVTGYAIRADGATLTVSGTLDGNRASIVLPASAYTVIGHISIVIKVDTTTVGACTSYVYQTTTDTIVDPGRVIPSIAELLAQIEACRTATTNANTAASSANTAAGNANTKAGLAEAAAGNANTAAGKIDNMTVEATTLSAGSQATVSVTEEDGHKHIVFGVPKGESGNETIDDTAGTGDTDKVWSADKSTKEVTDLKDALNSYEKYSIGNENLLANAGWNENYSISESGTITSNTNAHYTDLIPVENTEYVLWYKANGVNNSTRIHGYDSNGTWLRQIALSQSGTSISPISVKLNFASDVKSIRISMNKVVKPIILLKTYNGEDLFTCISGISEICADVEQTNDQVEIYADKVIGAKEIVNEITWVEGYSIKENGSLEANTYFHYTNQIPVKDGIYVYTYAGPGSNQNTRIHAYDENGNWIKQILLSKSGTSTTPITVNIPCSGYSYIKISTAKSVNVISLITPLLIASSEGGLNSIGLHTIPENVGVLNAIKRARQMTDVEWIPGADLLRAFMDTGNTYLTSHSQTYQGKFEAGKNYKGLPYSERNAPYRWLGIEVPLEAFCSAIQKENSVIANESTYSKYGADYYGSVCTSLTCYALDLPYTVSTRYNKIPGMSYVATVNNNLDVSVLKLCDIIQISGHCAIITDIYKDDVGRVTYIEISEQTRQGNSNRSRLTGEYGSVCRRITMTVKEFITWFSNFYIYRYSYIDRVGYRSCPYVPMPDEGNRICIHDYPLMPYMGNKTTYGTGSAPTVKIIFDTDAYTTLVVYKNGSLFGKYNIENQTYYNVVCDTDEAKYTACLAVLDGNQDISYSTQTVEWYCRPHDTPVVSVSNNKATISVTNSGEFKPYCVIIGTTFINGDYTKLFDSDYTKTTNNNEVTYSFEIPFEYAEAKDCKLYLRSEEWGVCEYNFTVTP